MSAVDASTAARRVERATGAWLVAHLDRLIAKTHRGDADGQRCGESAVWQNTFELPAGPVGIGSRRERCKKRKDSHCDNDASHGGHKQKEFSANELRSRSRTQNYISVGKRFHVFDNVLRASEAAAAVVPARAMGRDASQQGCSKTPQLDSVYVQLHNR
jgi:hypothetical protein